MTKNGLRNALEARTFVVAPGCYDALSARIAEQHGFGAVYMSGLAVTASLLARPDLELLGMAEMVRQADLIVSAVKIPVIADADTGYGGLSNVDRTVQAYQQAGVAAIHLEDQASPKRCGQTSGVRLIEAEAMASKLRVAVNTRGAGDMLIIGRTDAFRVNGVDEAIRRANLYAETGVDLLFVDGVSLPEDFRRIREGVRGKLVGSIVEVNAPARTRAEDLKAMGYSVAIHPISSILATAGTLDRLMADLRESGDTGKEFRNMMTYRSLNELLGIERYHRMWDGTN
ncbi:MAG: isocitrate lyase/PEP mutase family protein [Lentisphaerae bacterium]|nr:isocitrate lyase/PEP mutase family protein [Lentisphaerota bacterium]